MILVMKKWSLGLLIIIGLLTQSCINESDFISPSPLPEIPVQLVLQADLCPQNDTHWVEVSFSKPLFKPTNFDWEYPTRATINIIEENGKTSPNLTFEPRFNKYYVLASDYPISSGKKYTVKASAVLSRVLYRNEGSTIIPTLKPSDLRAEIDTFPFNNLEDRYKARLIWTDPGQSEDYFAYKAWYKQFNEFPNDPTSYEFWEEVYFKDDVRYWNDSRLNGKEIRIQDGELPLRPFFPDLTIEPTVIAFRAMLFYGNKDWYRYQTTRDNNYTDDPFSNAILSYSNTANGYGVVCGYNKVIMDYEFK